MLCILIYTAVFMQNIMKELSSKNAFVLFHYNEKFFCECSIEASHICSNGSYSGIFDAQSVFIVSQRQ